MTGKPLPSQALLAELLRYEPETGRLYSRALEPDHFAGTKDPRGANWLANAYNAQRAGKEAFTATDKKGYRQGKVKGITYQAHRIIWKLVYGEDPDTIDHRDGDTGNNRISNLRNGTVADNSRNYQKPRGSSRYRGVCWVERDQAWAARISAGKDGKRSLGNYRTEEDAARAYDRAARELHGEFATLNFPDDQRIRSALTDGGSA